MNNTILNVSKSIQDIINSTEHLPSQYGQKIEELCAAIIEVTAMGTGVHTTTIDVQNLSEGTHIVNGHTITIENGELRLGK